MKQSQQILISIFSLACLILLVFGGVLSHSFISFDDNLHLTENRWMNRVSLRSFYYFWTNAYENLYIPVSYSFFGVEALLSDFCCGRTADDELAPLLFKGMSLLLHLGCSLLVLNLLRSWSITKSGALVGAVLFAIHPLQVESVAWTSETRGLLAALFGLAALSWYVRSLSDISNNAQLDVEANATIPLRDHLISLLMLTLALLAKPSAVSVVLIAGLVGLVLFQQSFRQLVWGLSVWLLPVLVTVLISRSLQSGEQVTAQLPLTSRIFVAVDSLGFYLTKVVYPAPLIADYGRTPSVALAYPNWQALVAVSLFLTVLCWWKANRVVPLSGAVFVAGLAPTLGLVPFGFQEISTVADRYAYLAMLGPAVLVAWSWRKFPNVTFRGSLIATGIILCGVSFVQTRNWKNSETLYAHILKENPNSWISLNNLGDLFAQRGEILTAQQYFEQSIEVRPTLGKSYRNLAVCYAQLGDAERAFELYRKAVKLSPGDAVCQWSLATDYFKRGKLEEAQQHYQIAIQQDESQPELWTDYGVLLAELDQHQQAVSAYLRGIELGSNHWGTHVNLAHSLLQLGQDQSAVEEYRLALKLNPDIPEARLNLGLLAARHGQFEKAIRFLEEVVSENSPDASASLESSARDELAAVHSYVGLAAFEQGNLKDALSHLLRAVTLRPEDAASHFHLARVQIENGQKPEAIAHLNQVLTLVPKESQAAVDTLGLLAELQRNDPIRNEE